MQYTKSDVSIYSSRPHATRGGRGLVAMAIALPLKGMCPLAYSVEVIKDGC